MARGIVLGWRLMCRVEVGKALVRACDGGGGVSRGGVGDVVVGIVGDVVAAVVGSTFVATVLILSYAR